MDQLSAALGSALEEALTGDAAAPLTRDDMARKTREEIEAAVHKALISSQVLDAIRNPDLVHSLLLEMAAAGKREQLISALQRGANPDSRYAVRPFPLASRPGRSALCHSQPILYGCLRCSLAMCPRSNPKGETALILATKARSAPCVRTLLVAKADLSLTDSDGRSALHHAASLYDEATLLLLLDHGADLHVEDADGKDALALLERHDIARLTQSFEHYRIEYERRTQIASRIQLYQAGQMPPYHAASDSSSVEGDDGEGEDACGPSSRRGCGRSAGNDAECTAADDALSLYRGRRWSETSHRFCPPCMREAIRTMLLASNRRMEGESCCLPTELWLHVFRHMHRDWFDDADERRRRHAAAQERRAAAVQQRRENERELKHTEEAIRMLEAVIEGDELGRVAVAGPLNRLLNRRDELKAQLTLAARTN